MQQVVLINGLKLVVYHTFHSNAHSYLSEHVLKRRV